jgi:hypothetical protein
MRLRSVAAVRTLAPAAEGLGVQVRPQPARMEGSTCISSGLKTGEHYSPAVGHFSVIRTPATGSLFGER